MPRVILHRSLPDESAMARFAAQMAALVHGGDTLLLTGDIGAGKSAFARGFIRAKLDRAEDVPSPTFTLVQTYDAPDAEIWHCDLYRLTHPDEVMELGLDEAFGTAICLIEWPDRLAGLAPDTALTLSFKAGDHAHEVTASGPAPWPERLGALHD